jgi:hypothetical protein
LKLVLVWLLALAASATHRATLIVRRALSRLGIVPWKSEEDERMTFAFDLLLVTALLVERLCTR